MARGTNTKTQILDTAQHLLLEKGFNAFSYKDISSSLGIRNAAVHYHYPSKEDLGVAVIQRTRKNLKAAAGQLEDQNVDPWRKLDWFFSIFASHLQKSEVCFGGSLGTDFHAIPGKMQAEVQGLISEILTWLERLLQDGRNQGEFSFPGDPANKAFTVLAVVQGALQIARVTTSDQFNIAVNQLKGDLRG